MSFDVLRRGRVVAGLALLLAAFSAVPVAAQMRSSEDQTMTANDETAFVVTRAVVRAGLVHGRGRHDHRQRR